MNKVNKFGVPDSVPNVPEMSEEDRSRAIELLNKPREHMDPDVALVQEFLHREILKLWHSVHNLRALHADQERRVDAGRPYTFNI